MDRSESAFRHLATSYASALITRQQYVMIRSLLLKKLQTRGTIEGDDLENFTKIAESTDPPGIESSYTLSDWIIVVLGIAASVALGYVLYS